MAKAVNERTIQYNTMAKAVNERTRQYNGKRK
jgi:hypothetical protein